MKRDWLEGFSVLSLVLYFIGFAAAFTPMKGTVGALCPIGLAMFWIAGIIARRRDRLSQSGGRARP